LGSQKMSALPLMRPLLPSSGEAWGWRADRNPCRVVPGRSRAGWIVCTSLGIIFLFPPAHQCSVGTLDVEKRESPEPWVASRAPGYRLYRPTFSGVDAKSQRVGVTGLDSDFMVIPSSLGCWRGYRRTRSLIPWKKWGSTSIDVGSPDSTILELRYSSGETFVPPVWRVSVKLCLGERYTQIMPLWLT